MNTERKIHFSTMFDDFKKVFLIILLLSGTIGMLGDMFMQKTQSRIYTSEALLSVAARQGDTRYAMYTNLNVTQQMAKTFSYIMNSDIIEQVVEEDLGTTELNGRISMSVTENTNMMTLRVHGNSPQEAFEIMNSIINHYQDLCDQIMPGSYIELLQVPKVPLTPSNPLSHVRNVNMISLGVFIVFSLIICYASYLKDTIKESKDIEDKIDAPLFGSLPFQKMTKKERKKGGRPILVTDVKTSFSYVEAFKLMRVKIEGGDAKVIMVTSALENEGKSTVSTNLAITLAKNKKKVLLMDLDLRNPSVAKMFNYKVNHEILEYLDGQCQLSDALSYDKRFKLFYLLGKNTSEKAPELISSAKMEKLMSLLRHNFDYIIVDTVPSRYLTDALAAADYCDAILMVVRQNYATSTIINDTLDVLKKSDKTILGCVFNHSVKDTFERVSHYSYYGRYGSYYGYRKYGYGGYGKDERESN